MQLAGKQALPLRTVRCLPPVVREAQVAGNARLVTADKR